MAPEADLDVIGFGALNIDIIYRLPSVTSVDLVPDSETVGVPGGADALVSRIEEAGGEAVSVSAGGSAANTVQALARMGFLTGFVGAVGEDHASTVLVEGLGRPDALSIARRGDSGRTVIAVGDGGDRSIVVFPGANDALAPADVDRLLVARTRVLHLSSFVGESPLEAQLETVGGLPRDITVSFDPGALYSNRRREAIGPILERADIVLLGEGELVDLTGEARREEAAGRLMDLGVGTVVVKRGPRGMHAFWEGGDHLLGARPEEVRGDSVGAGDVADAGYLAGVLMGLPPPSCAALAHASAVQSLAGFGRACYPDRDFLQRFLDSYGGDDDDA